MNRDAATVDSQAEANGAMAEPVPLEFDGGAHAAETDQLAGAGSHSWPPPTSR